MPDGFHRFATYAAAGISGLIALALLNVAADRLDVPGLSKLRNYITGTH